MKWRTCGTTRWRGTPPHHVLPHSGTLPQERTRIGRHRAVVGQREHPPTMRPDVAVLPPARLLPGEHRTPHRLLNLAPLVGGGRGPEGRHFNLCVRPRPRRVKPRSRLSVSQSQSVDREYTSNIRCNIRNIVR
eukprot:372068-Prorocentrum_minimum.AAC.1